MKIFWDWDGTLGTKPFWYRLAAEDANFAARLDKLFANDDVQSWMRGGLSFDAMHNKFLHGYDIDYLRERLVRDWCIHDVFNADLWNDYTARYPDAKHYIVTDNMDIFNDFVAANQKFFERFEKIYNSSDYGVLKSDPAGLLSRVMEDNGGTTFSGDLLLDDGKENCETFISLGGNATLVAKAR